MNEHDKFFDELKKDVDADHRRIDGAGAPPTDMWKSIRAQAKPVSKEEERTMFSSNTISHVPAPVSRPVAQQKGGVRHTLSLAASFLIVMSVALGGWFATMQLNQPGGSNGQFAFLGQSDENATCDVEPMTVDEAMEIVENPYRYMDEGDYPEPWGSTTHQTPWLDDYQEVQPKMASSIQVGNGDVPTQVAFDQASAVISQYIACMQEDGSVAMMLRFSDPFSIQHHVRIEFPFYRSEDEVREYVTDWLQSGEEYYSLDINRRGEALTFRQTNDKSMATRQIRDFGLGFDQIMYVGTEVLGEDGEYLGTTHPTLRRASGSNEELLDYGVVFTLLHSQYTDQWYVVTEGWLFSSF